MASEVSWKLPERIINLSQANTWAGAISEWRRAGIERLDDGEESKRCLCDHFPIRELCYVVNTVNGNRTLVGNHCVEKFKDDAIDDDEFKSIPRIFQALNRILKDQFVSANDELLEQAVREEIFSEEEAGEYQDIKRKRKPNHMLVDYKYRLNQRLIYAMATSARTSYKVIKNDRTKSANSKLIEFAFEKKVLTQNNYDFYMKIWKSAHTDLNENQKIGKFRLNKKIVDNLSHYFDVYSICSTASQHQSKKRRIEKTQED